MTETNLPTLNADLLSDLVLWAVKDDEKVKAKIEKDFPGWGSWEQGTWAKKITNGFCKTSFCMAGQAVVQSGYGLIYDDLGGGLKSASDCAPIVGFEDMDGVKVARLDHERTRTIWHVAMEALGIDSSEQDAFFDGDNTIKDVVIFACLMMERRGIEPANYLPADVLAIAHDDTLETTWGSKGLAKHDVALTGEW